MTLKELVSSIKSDSNKISARIENQYRALQDPSKTNSALIRSYEPRDLRFAYSEETPLLGLTFTVKDLIGVKDAPISWGIEPPAILQNQFDAEIVSKLKALGAVNLGSSNLDELALGAIGENQYFGDPVNFRDAELITGGSSSGASILVASGLSDFAVASDSGGSIRIPAFANGVSALQLCSSRFSKNHTLLLDDPIDSFGLIAPGLHDLFFLASSIDCEAGPTPKRIVISSAKDMNLVSSEIRNQFEQMVKVLSGEFNVCSAELPFSESIEIRKVLISLAFKTLIMRLELGPERLTPEGRALLKMGESITSRRSDECKNNRDVIIGSLLELLGSDAVILTPVLPYPIPKRRELQNPTSAVRINHFLTLSNIAGLPALAFPHPKEAGLGVHLIGSSAGELGLLAFAEEVSRALT